MTGSEPVAGRQRGRRELAALLAAGVIGAGLVLLASRQEFARVEVVPVHPLPVSVTTLSWQALRPADPALALAALASMAAVLATRGLPRRLTGLITALLGAGIGLAAAGTVSTAAVLAAAGKASLSAASGADGGTGAGSTTAGPGGGQTAGALAGFPRHVVVTGSIWRALILAGAAIIVLAGIAVIIRAARLPGMSSRYERSGWRSGQAARPAAGTSAVSQRAAAREARAPGMWESLSAGADPTAGPAGD